MRSDAYTRSLIVENSFVILRDRNGNPVEEKARPHMGTGRKYQTKPRTRLKKSNRERKRRTKLHKKRLAAMGVSEGKLARIDLKGIRAMLRASPKKQAKMAKA